MSNVPASTSARPHGTKPASTHKPVVALVGGTGFLGKYIAQILAREGYRLKLISRNPNASLSIKTIGDLGQAVLLKGNLSNPESVTKHLAGCNVVINLTGILFERGSQKFNAIHAQGAEKLAQAAYAQGVSQYIHISALGVDKAGNSSYARTKLLGEKAVRNAFPQAVILRPGVVFGPEDNFYNRFAQMASAAPALPLIGGGEQKFQPVYVVDVARAVLACMKSPADTAGRVYELGGPQIYTLKQIMESICRTLGKKPRFVRLSFGMAGFMAWFMEYLPIPPLTRDQVRLLQYDNVVSLEALGFKELGIAPTAAEMVVPEYLARFRSPSVRAQLLMQPC